MPPPELMMGSRADALEATGPLTGPCAPPAPVHARVPRVHGEQRKDPPCLREACGGLSQPL